MSRAPGHPIMAVRPCNGLASPHGADRPAETLSSASTPAPSPELEGSFHAGLPSDITQGIRKFLECLC